jgi:hypothetical protein
MIDDNNNKFNSLEVMDKIERKSNISIYFLILNIIIYYIKNNNNNNTNNRILLIFIM